MAKLTRIDKEELQERIKDTSLSLDERRAAHEELMDSLFNPKFNFDPATFDPMEEVEDYEAKKRDRVEPSRTLQTMGMKPKKIREGQMIGMFESKQDLYLLIAWLSERVTELEDEVISLGQSIKK